jgi:hypothetical protein
MTSNEALNRETKVSVADAIREIRKHGHNAQRSLRSDIIQVAGECETIRVRYDGDGNEYVYSPEVLEWLGY